MESGKLLPQEISTEEGIAGNWVQVMHEILMPLLTYFLSLFSDIRAVLIIYFVFILQTTKPIFGRAKELTTELINKYSQEYVIYLTEKVSVRRSMDTEGLSCTVSLE